MRWLGKAIALVVVIAACTPPRAAPTATQRLNAPAIISVPPGAPPEEACIGPEVEAELACRPDDDRVSPDISAWPNADFLFHYPPRKAWVSPVLPESLTSDVAKLALGQSKLAAAEKAFGAAQWRAARDAFAALLKDLPKEDALRAYAYARVAMASESLGQFDDALAAVLAEKDVLRTNSGLLGADVLSERLPGALGRAFARSKRAPDDIGSFKDDELESIVDGYDDAMRYDAARTVLGELIKRSDPAKGCVYGARRVSTSIEQNFAVGKRVIDGVQEQGKFIELTNSSKCETATLAVTEEIAMALHADAVGWNGVRGTSDARTIANVGKLYEMLVADLGRRESWPPGFADEQRPTRDRLNLARSDLTLFLKDYEKCGAMFEGVAVGTNDATIRRAATAKATRCFAAAVEQQSKAKGQTAQETKLVSWSRRYLCTIAGDNLGIALARGRVFYRTEQWELAVAALNEPAFTAGRKEAREAAAMYLVALYRMREVSRRQSCQEQRERDRARLLALHCSGADEDDPIGPAIPGLTVSDPKRGVTPCEAMRNLGAPPPPLPAPPPKPAVPRFHGDSTMVNGNAVPEVVAWATRLHTSQWQACYDLALERDPFLSGREWFSFTIARDGAVSVARAGSEDHTDAELDKCVTRVAGSMSFSQPEGGLVDVRWTLAFDRVRGVRLTGRPTISQR